MGFLGGLGDAIGGLYGGSAYSGMLDSKFQKKAMQAQKDAIKAMLALQQEGMDTSQGLFGQAEDQINAVGPAMRQELLAQGERGVADSTSNALSTGLSGTSAYQGMLRGSRADTGRNLGLLEESLAGARSRLYERRGSEVYQQYIDRANIRQRTKYDPFLQGYSSDAQTSGTSGFMGDMMGMFGGMFGGGGAG